MGSLFCTAGIPLCREEIFPCNRFSPPMRDKKVNSKISIEVHFNRSKIFILCFYHSYDVNLWEKKLTNIFVSFYRSSHRRCSAKKLVLKFYNIHRKTPVLEPLYGPSTLKFYQKVTPTLMFSREYCETFKNIYFEEHLRTTASYFMEKDRHGWRLNNSSKKNLNQWKSMNLQFCKITYLQRKIQRKCMQI